MNTRSRSLRTAKRMLASFGVLFIAVAQLGAAEAPALPVPDECTNGAMPSCAPREHWDCIHPGVHIPNKCDPESTGCLSDS